MKKILLAILAFGSIVLAFVLFNDLSVGLRDGDTLSMNHESLNIIVIVGQVLFLVLFVLAAREIYLFFRNDEYRKKMIQGYNTPMSKVWKIKVPWVIAIYFILLPVLYFYADVIALFE